MINSKFKIDVRYGEKYPNDEVIWKSEKKHNLINNDGLAMFASYWATECTQNVYLESGGRVNARWSGAISGSQIGTTVTFDDPFFLEADTSNLRLLVFADGTQRTLSSFTDSETAEVLESGNVTAQSATIYYVEETHMDGFVKASNTYATWGGAIDNSWSVASDVLTLTNKRTILFPAEAADVVYKGVGWTPLSGSDQQVLGRKVINIEVSSGAQPVIEVTITRKIDVSSNTVDDVLIAGLSETATSMNMMGSTSYNTNTYWSSIDSTGNSVAPAETSTFMECKTGSAPKIALGEYSGLLILTNTDITADPYATKSPAVVHIPGTFYYDYVTTFNPSDFSTVDWNTVSLLNDSDNTEAFWRLLFDNSQDFNSHMLSGLRIRKSWNRYY